MTVKDPLAQVGHTVCLLLGPGVRPGAYSKKAYAYSILRTLESSYGGLAPLGHAAEVPPLTAIWR